MGSKHVKVICNFLIPCLLIWCVVVVWTDVLLRQILCSVCVWLWPRDDERATCQLDMATRSQNYGFSMLTRSKGKLDLLALVQ